MILANEMNLKAKVKLAFVAILHLPADAFLKNSSSELLRVMQGVGCNLSSVACIMSMWWHHRVARIDLHITILHTLVINTFIASLFGF